jgi:hypothetical protein
MRKRDQVGTVQMNWRVRCGWTARWRRKLTHGRRIQESCFVDDLTHGRRIEGKPVA